MAFSSFWMAKLTTLSTELHETVVIVSSYGPESGIWTTPGAFSPNDMTIRKESTEAVVHSFLDMFSALIKERNEREQRDIYQAQVRDPQFGDDNQTQQAYLHIRVI